MSKTKFPKVNVAANNDGDWREFVERENCPVCGADESHIEIKGDENTYIDDEECYLTSRGPRYMPYKAYVCSFCGAEIHAIMGVIGVHIAKDSDIDIEGVNV